MAMNSDIKHPEPCRLCRHYHGRPHGGVMLVCAMHAYGPEDGQCEDYEKLGPDAPPTAKLLPRQQIEPVDEAMEVMPRPTPRAWQVLQELIYFLVAP